jgi:predicted Ser/Thr protein kinase
MIGRLIGNRYKIIRELGSGGMARVYLAKDNKKFSLMAVKILYPQLSENFTYIQRFNREAKMAMHLSDPHIVSVLDYGADKDDHYLVMEYVEGNTLTEVLREEGPLSWERALTIAYQAAEALREAHRQHIVHRDIKPANIMITPEGTARVLDFGIARGSDLPTLTQSGFVGSPYYISPEQAKGEEVDIRSDIYSLGVVLYEMLSNRLPFEAETPWPIINQHISADPPALSAICEDLPQEVALLVHKMLAKAPEDRLQTPAELMWAIESILPEVAPAKVTEESEAPVKEELEERPSLLPSLRERFVGIGPIALVAVIVAFAVVGTAFAYQLLVTPTGRCSAYLEAGITALEAFSGSGDLQHLQEASAQFDQGLTACPDDAMLQQERYLASFCLIGIEYYEEGRWEQAIASFEDIRRSSSDYGGTHLANLLYSAYLNLGDQYYQSGDLDAALQQYQAALGVGIPDSTDAQRRHDEVREEVVASQATPTPTRRPTRTPAPTPTPTPMWIPPAVTPTSTPVVVKYPAPRLVEPKDGNPFGGDFGVTLKWEPVALELEADECYRVSLYTMYSNQVDWSGSSDYCVKETEYVPPDFIVDRSDTHEFTWFVWVSLDQQDASGEWIRLSPDSEKRTFSWGP